MIALLVALTFYGYPDNSPPGYSIAYPSVHKQAAGVGTYKDPITFATSKDFLKPGSKLYIPSLKKYVIMEDNCADCVKDYKKGIKHIDVWINSDSKNKKAVLKCEDKWTPDGKVTIEQNPASNLTVDSRPLFNTTTGKCL